MQESEYHTRVDQLMARLELCLDGAETDLDYVNNNGLLTITCATGVQLVLSRQAPLQQLWLASPAGGQRFVWVQDKWVLEQDRQLSLAPVLADLLQRYGGEQLSIAALEAMS